MRKKALRVFSNILLGLSVILVLSSNTFAFIAWKGVVLDKETGEPIEGAVIVRSWDRVTAGPAGTVSILIAFKETLSDRDGKFTIFRKLPSLSIPILSWVEENSPIVYKPGYKFLVLRDKPRVIELTRIPTIPSLRKKELNEASWYIDIDFKYPTNIFLQIIAKERDFIETSLYLIDALPLIDSLRDSSPGVVRKHAANLLAETVDVRATDSLIGVLGDKDWLLRLEAIKALAKRKDPRAVESLINALVGSTYKIQPSHAARALVKIGTPAVEELCAVLQGGSSLGRVYAAWALGEIRDHRALEPLMNALHDKWAKVRRTAAEALAKFNEKRTAEALITIALRDNGRKVRQNAAEALEKTSYPALKVLFTQSQNKVLNVGIPATFVLDKTLDFGAGQVIKHEIGAVKGEDLIATIPPATGLDRSENIQGTRTSVPIFAGKGISIDMAKVLPGGPERKLRSIVYIAAKLQNKKKGARKMARLTFGKAKDSRRIRYTIPLLKHKDWRRRIIAVKALAKIQDSHCVPHLIDALQDGNKEVRLSAAVALGRIKHPLAVRYLISALKDEEAIIRRTAAQALGEINNTIVLVPLVRTMDDLAVGMKIPLALVRFKDTWIEDQLIAGLWDENFKDRSVLVDVLGKIRKRKAADRIIAAAKEDRSIQSSAFKALAQIGEPSIEPLFAALKDEDSSMRWHAASALGKISDTRAVEPLIFALQDEHSSVKWHAAWALGKIKDSRAVEPLFAMSMKDKQSKIRKQALAALVEMGPVAVERLLHGLKETRSYYRWRAAWALGRIRATETVEPLINALSDEVPEVRWIASVALGEIRDPRAIAPLNALRNDEDLGVRSCAEFSLTRIKGEKSDEF